MFLRHIISQHDFDAVKKRFDGDAHSVEQISLCNEFPFRSGSDQMDVPEFVEGRKKIFDLTTHATHFIYGYMASDMW